MALLKNAFLWYCYYLVADLDQHVSGNASSFFEFSWDVVNSRSLLVLTVILLLLPPLKRLKAATSDCKLNVSALQQNIGGSICLN